MELQKKLILSNSINRHEFNVDENEAVRERIAVSLMHWTAV